MNNYYEEDLDSILSLRADLSESLQEDRSQFSRKNILLMGQESTESKELYVIEYLSLRGIIESAAVFVRD